MKLVTYLANFTIFGGIAYFDNKGTHSNTAGEMYMYMYIYKETVTANQVDNKHTTTCNKISETVLNREVHLTKAPSPQQPATAS